MYAARTFPPLLFTPLQSGHELPGRRREDRGNRFVAVARGVMKHLEQNVNDCLVVTYDAGYRANVDIHSE